jgi:hypothetical protein
VRSLVVLIACAGTAHAERNTDFVARPLVLAPGELDAQLTLEMGFPATTIISETSLAPDLWVGVTRRLTVGLVHSNRSVDLLDAGNTICLRDKFFDCDGSYHGSGLDARYAIRDDLAPRVRVLLRDLDPAKPATMLGVLARWQRGRLSVTTDPYLRLGLANRDRGNRAAINLPVWLAVQPTCRWVLAFHTGLASDLAVLRDGWHPTVALIAGVNAVSRLDLFVELGYPSLGGPQHQFTRMLVLTVAWRQQVIKPKPPRTQ